MIELDRRVPERRFYGERARVHFARETVAENQLIHLPDGRKLAVKSFGNPTDPVVVLFTGSPGSRLGPVPFDKDLKRMGVRLITFDRPGYGDSDPNPSYTAANVAADIKYALHEMDIRTCSIAGRSGGGRHALEFALLYPEVVKKVAILAGDIPPQVKQSVKIETVEPTQSNKILYKATALTEEEIQNVTTECQRLYDLALKPGEKLTVYPPGLDQTDRDDIALVDGLEEALLSSYREAWSKGHEAFLQDALAARKDWGENLEKIKAPVQIYHGTNDHFVPYEYGLWLANKLPNAQLVTLAGNSHFITFKVFPEALSWLIN